MQTRSRLGIAACVLAVAVPIGIAALVALATLMGTRSHGGVDENSPLAILVGLALIGAVLLELLALAVAATALFLPGRRKLFPLLAVVFATTSITCVAALVLLGLAA